MSDHSSDHQLLTLVRTDLHAHADHLDVPHVPAAAVLGHGRRLRRRRHLAAGAGAVAASVVLGGALLLSLPSGRQDSAPDPATTPGDAAVFAVGSRVYVGGSSVTVPGTIHSLHYTSEGVLVRSNDRGGASDGSGPETLTLVRGDGQSVDLGEVPEGYGPATDPDLPYYALAERQDGRLYAVVRDVGTGEVAQRVPLPDLDSGGWDVPPLSLMGDLVFARFGDRTYSFDRTSGTEVPISVKGAGEIRGGYYASTLGERRVIRSVLTGDLTLAVNLPEDAYGWLELSPDGFHAMAFVEELAGGEEVTETTVYDVDTGRSVVVEGAPWELGWTRDGSVYRVDGDVVTTCSTATGACTEETIEVDRVSEPEPVERTETTCDKNGENCGTMTWTEASSSPGNKVTLAGRSYES